jgi:uroporphyrinogen-III synthase
VPIAPPWSPSRSNRDAVTTTPAQSPHAKPLRGVRILVTRAQAQAAELTSLLSAQGAEVIEVPTIEIRPPASYAALDAALCHIAQYDWLVLTSASAVRALFDRLGEAKIAPDKLRALSIAAIGPVTRKAIEEQGLAVAVMPERYVAESVVDALRDRVRGRRVLLVRAKIARDVIPAELRKAGAEVGIAEAYETVVPVDAGDRLHEALAARPQVITFTSSSTARHLVSLLSGDTKRLDGITLASIGPVTSQTLRELGLRVEVEAREHTMAGLTRAIVDHFASGVASRGGGT